MPKPISRDNEGNKNWREAEAPLGALIDSQFRKRAQVYVSTRASTKAVGKPKQRIIRSGFQRFD
jgi:hypothetical protein